MPGNIRAARPPVRQGHAERAISPSLDRRFWCGAILPGPMLVPAVFTIAVFPTAMGDVSEEHTCLAARVDLGDFIWHVAGSDDTGFPWKDA